MSEAARLHEELRRMSEKLATYLRRDGQAARTVTTKLRYADFSIRTFVKSSAPAPGRAPAKAAGKPGGGQ